MLGENLETSFFSCQKITRSLQTTISNYYKVVLVSSQTADWWSIRSSSETISKVEG